MRKRQLKKGDASEKKTAVEGKAKGGKHATAFVKPICLGAYKKTFWSGTLEGKCNLFVMPLPFPCDGDQTPLLKALPLPAR